MINFTTKLTYPNFIVDLFKNEALPEILQIGNQFGYQVRAINLTSTHSKQRFNCQKYCHSSDVCTLDPVCIKCSGCLLSRTCRDPRDKIRCAYCGQNHISNFSQCPKDPKVIKNAKLAAIQEAAILKDASFHIQKSSIRPGINFATTTANRKSRLKPQLQAPPTI